MEEIVFNRYPGVTVERYQGDAPHWRLNTGSSWVVDTPEAGINVYGIFWREGKPDDGAILLEHWPDAPAEGIPHLSYVNAKGQTEANFGLYNSMPAVNVPGPYWAEVQDGSDIVHGLGLLPGKRHIEWWFQWDWVEGNEIELPPSETDNVDLRLRLARAYHALAVDLEKPT